MQSKLIITTALTGLLTLTAAKAEPVKNIELGPRPYYLIDQLPEGSLKEKLKSCTDMDFKPHTLSIGHRGAPLQFPEHTIQSYKAAARMGAGVLECDVAFTKDKALVCRHAQNDLHATTNILQTKLATKCSKPFTPADADKEAEVECRTSDITLAEFLTLEGKMDAGNAKATTVDDYMNSTPNWRTDLYASNGKVMTHAQSIELFKTLGVKFTPELKSPVVEMPFDGFTQAQYAQKLVDEYKAADVDPSQVWLQSFNLQDVLYWIENEPEFGKQAVYLDERDLDSNFNTGDPQTWQPSMQELKAMGVNYIAPPLWMLVTVKEGELAMSAYALEAKKAGLKIISWSLERSGPLDNGGGWYYQSIADITKSDAMIYQLLDFLVREVGVEAVFSDWPATTTYYANCMGL